MSTRAAIVSVAGPTLLPEEEALLRSMPPAGVILFRRNCVDRAQLARLTADLRAAVAPARLLILVDQEGGRVMRLAPPGWERLPAMRAIGLLAEDDLEAGQEAAGLAGRIIAADLRQVGIDIACAPCLDVGRPGTTDAIGDRAFARDAALVATLGGALARGLLAGDVTPVMKHCPGHGAATLDSHAALPIVALERDELAGVDWVPFAANRGLPLAMTGHVVYSRLDPLHPATMSAVIINDVIRAVIGFEGPLITDDLSMGALAGPLAERAQAALEAGCDLALYCAGHLDEAAAVLGAVPLLAPSRAAQLAALPCDVPFVATRAAEADAARAALSHLLASGPVA